MSFLSNAELGRDYLVRESLVALTWKDSPFVVREAAEKAIKAGDFETFEILLPNVPLHWMPELVYFCGQQGRADMVDLILKQVQCFRKISSGVFFYNEFNGKDQEKYFESALIEQGIRGAASTGRLDCLETLASLVNQSGYCKVAAIAAIENQQPEILHWSISNISRRTLIAFEVTINIYSRANDTCH